MQIPQKSNLPELARAVRVFRDAILAFSGRGLGELSFTEDMLASVGTWGSRIQFLQLDIEIEECEESLKRLRTIRKGLE